MDRMAFHASCHILVVLCLSFGSVAALSQTDAATQKAVRIWPTEIRIGNITHSYPDSVWRRLTSSVPLRPQALSRVNLSFASEFILLTGASSSGKSTLFQLVLDDERPSLSGTVEIATSSTRPPCNFPTDTTIIAATMESKAKPPWSARPVLLEEKAFFPSGRETPRQNLLRCCCSYITGMDASMGAILVDAMAQSLHAQDWMDTMTELSQSQLLVWKLIESALVSSLQGSAPKDCPVPDDYADFPAPILLLDEWLDKETTVVIRKVQESLQSLAATTGAVILCATHVPDRFAPCRQITLQSGRVLSDVARREPE